MKKTIFSLIVLTFLGLWFSLGWFNPDALTVRRQSGPQLAAALSQDLIAKIQAQILEILKAIEGIQKQLTALVKETEVLAPAEPVLAPAPAPLPALIASDLKFKIDFPAAGLRNYLEFPLLTFVPETKEKIAITKLQFTQVGTLRDLYLDNIRLYKVVGNSEVLLAKVIKPVNGVIEFNLTPDVSKLDQGLVVPDKEYRVMGEITLIYGVVRPTASLELKATSSISAFDANDLTRPAELPKGIFPIQGPIHTISRD